MSQENFFDITTIGYLDRMAFSPLATSTLLALSGRFGEEGKISQIGCKRLRGGNGFCHKKNILAVGFVHTDAVCCVKRSVISRCVGQ
jgi:hypothetical protein